MLYSADQIAATHDDARELTCQEFHAREHLLGPMEVAGLSIQAPDSVCFLGTNVPNDLVCSALVGREDMGSRVVRPEGSVLQDELVTFAEVDVHDRGADKRDQAESRYRVVTKGSKHRSRELVREEERMCMMDGIGQRASRDVFGSASLYGVRSIEGIDRLCSGLC